MALMNIINNAKGIDLGPDLQRFKEFTKDLAPPLRGHQIDNFSFVKKVHNSFARYAPFYVIL